MPFDFRPAFQRALPYIPFLEKYGTAENRARWQHQYDAVHLSAAQLDLLSSFRRQMPVLCLAGPWCGDCVAACPIAQRFAEAQPLIDLRFINRAHGPVPHAAAAVSQTGAANDPDDIRSRPIGKILVKWGILTPERVEKALLVQEEKKSHGLNVRIGDVMTDMGLISPEQRDHALAAQSGHANLADSDAALAVELHTCGAARVPNFVFLSEDFFECQRFADRTITNYRDRARLKLSHGAGAHCPAGLMTPSKDILTAVISEWLEIFERVQWMLLTSSRLAHLHGEA